MMIAPMAFSQMAASAKPVIGEPMGILGLITIGLLTLTVIMLMMAAIDLYAHAGIWDALEVHARRIQEAIKRRMA